MVKGGGGQVHLTWSKGRPEEYVSHKYNPQHAENIADTLQAKNWLRVARFYLPRDVKIPSGSHQELMGKGGVYREVKRDRGWGCNLYLGAFVFESFRFRFLFFNIQFRSIVRRASAVIYTGSCACQYFRLRGVASPVPIP